MDSPVCDKSVSSFHMTLNHYHIEDKNNCRNDFADDMIKPRPDFPLGGVVLDVAERDLAGIVTRVVDHMIASGQVPSDHRDDVIGILLRKPSLSFPSDSTSSSSNSTDELIGGMPNGTLPRDSMSESPTYIHYGSSIDVDIGEIKDKEHEELSVVMAGGVSFLANPILVFVRLSEEVFLQDFNEVSLPARFLFVLLGCFDDEKDYREIGRSISALMASKTFMNTAYTAHSLVQLISAANDVLPRATFTHDITSESISNKSAQQDQGALTGGDDKKLGSRNPLIRVGKPFYGLYRDIKDRYPKYPSDIIDGFNIQVLAATIFIFFAFLSTAITFGGVYGDFTHNYIGVGECLLLSSVNGAIIALFAAQPLLMIGTTGPLMVFDKSLYQFTQIYEIDFLSMRVWIGLWMLVIGIIFTAFEAAVIMRKFTRFTEEIFASLISLIFVYEAVTKMVAIFRLHPLLEVYSSEKDIIKANVRLDDLNDTEVGLNTTGGDLPTLSSFSSQPNTALLSLILMMGTFIVATKLKKFRNSKFFGRSVRRALGDFGMPIAIILMVLLDYLIEDTFTDKLTMPEGIQPSNPDIRGWFINPFGQVKPLPVWCMFAAAPAAILVFFLVFLEGSICHLILSKPERKMVKGTGFHLDLVLSCFINLMSGLLGAPFMGPACIRTVAHAAALTVTSPARAPGQPLKVEGVREQRLSGLVVAILVGLSVLLSDALNLVPKAVLFGVFLYMGIASTAGIQFLERTVLMFMPVKYHPDTPYVNKVRTMKMHMFTIVQLIMLGVLWCVKESPAALVLPFVLGLLVPLRLYLLPIIFSKSELSAIDGSEAMKNDNTDEPDFHEASHALPAHADHHLQHLGII